MKIHSFGDIYLHDAGEEPEMVTGVLLQCTRAEVQAIAAIYATGVEDVAITPAPPRQTQQTEEKP